MSVSAPFVWRCLGGSTISSVSASRSSNRTCGSLASGQALWEECDYDCDTAQLLSGSLMDYVDYAMPRADSLPLLQTEISEVPSTTNPLGMRGGSEGGITPGLAVVANAIVDALTEFSVEHIELPATPERIWRAIRTSRGQR